MNSLTELNNFVGSLSIEYTDIRAADVIFNINTPINQNTIVDQGFTFQSSVGIDIVEVKNAAAANVYYTIQVTNVPGATVTWTSPPAGTTVNNPTPGTYNISGIDSYTVWDAVKYATIDLPDEYFGTFTYTSTINYTTAALGAQTKSWTTTVVVNQVTFLTTPSNFTYNSSSTELIENTPQIIDVDSIYPSATWTVTVTPSDINSITNFTTTATGGTFSVNETTKVITIEGTRPQINAYLANISLVSNSTEIDFTLTYFVENDQDNVTDSAVQILENYGLAFLSNPLPFYFIEDALSTSVTNTPLITEPDYNGLGTYTLTITPSNINAYSTMSAAGDFGTESFNGTTKVLTLTGTRSQVNDRLANLTFVLEIDYEDDFTLSFSLTTPRAETATKVQAILCGSNDTEVSFMNISRTFLTNNKNNIFSSNTPQIIDNDLTATNYTFTITSSFGQMAFGNNIPSNNVITFTGTRSECNAQFATIAFWPPNGSTSNGSFTYQQYKDGVLHAEYTIALLAQISEYTRKRSFLLTTSQVWTPDYEDLTYGNFDAALVGGGGAGGYYTDANYQGSGGGGGGQVVIVRNLSLTNTAYTVNVGNGGENPVYIIRPDVYIDCGTPGPAGGNTTAFGYTALGGVGGQTANPFKSCPVGDGGNSGSGNLGGSSLYSEFVNAGDDVFYYGGGGGASQLENGGDATLNIFSTTVGYGGRGGKGVFINWGNDANSMYGYYGGGGSGQIDYNYSNSGNTTTLPGASGSIGNIAAFIAAGKTIETLEPHVMTVSGATIDTSIKKFGIGSLSFNGNAKVTSSDIQGLEFENTADFTIECWYNLNSNPSTQMPLILFPSPFLNNFAWYGLWYQDGRIYGGWAGPSAKTINTNSGVDIGIWHHAAIVKNGMILELFIDGSSQGTVTLSGTESFTPDSGNMGLNDDWHIGSNPFDYQFTDKLDGYIDEVRVSNSIRYTGTFTPSTEPFNPDSNAVVLLHCDTITNGETPDSTTAVGGLTFDAGVGQYTTDGVPSAAELTRAPANSGGGGGGPYHYFGNNSPANRGGGGSGVVGIRVY